MSAYVETTISRENILSLICYYFIEMMQKAVLG